MSNGTKTIQVEFEEGKFIITEATGKKHTWTFLTLARYIVKNNMYWTELGQAKFDRGATHTREEVKEWLAERKNAMLYSITLDRIVMKVNGQLYMDGEVKEYLPWGDFIVHPMSDITDTYNGLYENTQPANKDEVKDDAKNQTEEESSIWGYAGTAVFGLIIGVLLSCNSN
jgi:hypothetical protein